MMRKKKKCWMKEKEKGKTRSPTESQKRLGYFSIISISFRVFVRIDSYLLTC
jgi:hypothetical protein